jgi:hypothetical protein
MYTPGPWTIQGSSINSVELRKNIAMYQRDISSMDEEHQGNARLIAAAPELLEALRELLALLEEHQGEAQWYTHGHYNHARAAIIKATEGAV